MIIAWVDLRNWNASFGSAYRMKALGKLITQLVVRVPFTCTLLKVLFDNTSVDLTLDFTIDVEESINHFATFLRKIRFINQAHFTLVAKFGYKSFC